MVNLGNQLSIKHTLTNPVVFYGCFGALVVGEYPTITEARAALLKYHAAKQRLKG